MQLEQFSETKLALGCDTTLTIVTSSDPELIFAKLWHHIFMFEKRFSRFLPSSELSIFNVNAGKESVISKEFKSILQSSYKMSELTEGLHNPFVLPALHRYGYHNSFVGKYSKDYQPFRGAERVASYEELKIRNSFAQIPEDSALDLGGCGKGYLADEIAKIAKSMNIQGFWFSVGGDIVSGGVDESGEPWELLVQNAKNAEETLDIPKITMAKNGYSAATSGTIIRKGKTNKLSWHHIIDPRTHKPADTDVLLATVAAKSTIEADVLATSAVILGSTKALDWLKTRAISAILQLDEASDYKIIGFGHLWEKMQSAKPHKMEVSV